MAAAPLSQTHTSLALPDLSPHCSCTVPVQEKGPAEPTIIGIVSGNKLGLLAANLHNQSVTFRLSLLQCSHRDENYFPLTQNRLQQTQV